MAKRISLVDIDKIKKLRRQGYSLPEIRKEISVGYGTIYRYVKDVEIDEKYHQMWMGKRGGSVKRKLLAEQIATEKVNQIGLSFSDKEKLLIVALLYWCEGNKSDFSLINSDPKLICVFLRGVNDILHVSPERIKVSIRIYEDMDREKCVLFWSSLTHKRSEDIHVNVLYGRKIGKLPYGMCRIRLIKGGNELKYVKAVYQFISKQMSS